MIFSNTGVESVLDEAFAEVIMILATKVYKVFNASTLQSYFCDSIIH